MNLERNKPNTAINNLCTRTVLSPWFVRTYGSILIENPETDAERAFNDRIETFAIRVTGCGWMAIHAKAALKLVQHQSQEYLRKVANEWMGTSITEVGNA